MFFSVAARGQFHEQFERAVKDSTFYLITTGHKTKTALIAGEFNHADSVSTHVGIVIKVDGKNTVYHVTDTKEGISALKVEPLEAFLSADHVYFASLWRIRTAYPDYVRMVEALGQYSERSITFDLDFQLENGDSLYCSEFCSLVLNRATASGLKFEPSRKELSEFYRTVLKRDTLEYFPVDFFQRSTAAHLILYAYK